MSLTKEQILGADDLKREKVKVREWGGEVIVQEMTAVERVALMEWGIRLREEDETKYNTQAAAKIVSLCVVDEGGDKLFEDADLDLLVRKNHRILERISEVARRLSGMREEDNEEMIKNSKKGQSEDSISG